MTLYNVKCKEKATPHGVAFTFSSYFYKAARREDGKDEYGVQVRRLSTGNKDDDWTIDEGYKSQKRFMLFEYLPNELK